MIMSTYEWEKKKVLSVLWEHWCLFTDYEVPSVTFGRAHINLIIDKYFFIKIFSNRNVTSSSTIVYDYYVFNQLINNYSWYKLPISISNLKSIYFSYYLIWVVKTSSLKNGCSLLLRFLVLSHEFRTDHQNRISLKIQIKQNLP